MLSILRTDAGLVRQVLTGHSTQFEELVRRHFNMVYGIAFSYTRNHADAEDLSQEAFVKAYQRLDSLEDKRKFGHWISVITRNLARTWFVRRQREVEVLKEAKETTPVKSEAVYDDMREVLEHQINELDPIPREVLIQHYFSGHSTAEIAKAMGVSQAAVLKRLQRAREALGVKLIHELKVIPPVKHNANQRRRKIMSSITATGITWKLGEGWASATVSTVLSGKALLTGVLVTGAVATLMAVSPTPQPPKTTITNASTALATVALNDQDMEQGIESSEMLPEAIDEESVSLESTVLLAAAESTEEPAETISAVETEETDPESLEGRWRLYAGATEDSAEGLQEFGTVELLRNGNELKINHNDLLKAMVLEGEVIGLKVNMKIFNEETDWERPMQGFLKGSFNEMCTVLTLEGGLDNDSNGSFELELTVRIEKLTDDESKAEEALAKAQETLKELHATLIAYMREYKVSPKTLKRDYANEKSIEMGKGERIFYTPISYEYLIFEPPSGFSELESWQNFLATKEPSYLLDLEKELASIWGTNFPGAQKLIKLRNTTYDFEISINTDGRIMIEKKPGSDGSAVDNTKNAQLRASCQNNMKQLGLVFKMYANESYNQYIPGGFRQTYPEYVTDLNVLICPGLNDGKVSYTILYPASRIEYCKELYEQIEGISAPPQLYISSVPWIMENKDCSDSGGRNVLFADGHAEFIKEIDWDTRMGPYLKYAYE